MAFLRQKYCSGLPFPSLGDLPNPENKPGSLALQADSLPSSHPQETKTKNPRQGEFLNRKGKEIDVWVRNQLLLDFPLNN